MKKVLFYSVAFAAALVSCTKEEVFVDVTAGNETQDLSIRPELGEVVLTSDAKVVTRFATGAGAQAQFEENDKLGAAIIDAPKYASAAEYATQLEAANGDASKLYDLVAYYSSNSAFTYDGSAWWLNEDQPLVEGNYLFYAPYNQSMNLRSQFTVAVPEVQDATSDKSALDAYYSTETPNVVKVGHQFLAYEGGEAQKPEVTMHDIMAYPKFTIVNNFKGFLVDKSSNGTTEFNGGAIKVTKIELINATGADLVVGGVLSNEKLVSELNGDWTETPFHTYTDEVLADDGKVVVADGEVFTTLNVNREIAQGGTAEIYAVLPAVQFDENGLKAKVYVEINGKPYIIGTAKLDALYNDQNKYTGTSVYDYADGNVYKTTTGPVTLIKGQAYPQEELNFDGTTLTAKKIKGNALKLELRANNLIREDKSDINGTPIQVAKEQEVESEPGVTPDVETDYIDNNAEFIAYFKELENGTALEEDADMTGFVAATSTTPQFRFSDENTVEINSALIDALSLYNNKGSLSLESALPIADDVTVSVAGTTVTFTSVNGKTYEITLADANYNISTAYVESEGKSIHVLTSWTAAADAVTGNVIVYKNATATVSADVQFDATSFVNNGTLNAYGVFINEVTNNGTINVGKEVYLVVDENGEGNIVITEDNEPTPSTNLVVTTGQTGIYKTTSIFAVKPYSWVSVLDVNADEVVLEAGDEEYLSAYAEVHLNAIDISFTHDAVVTFDMGENTTYFMEHTNAMTIAGMNKSLTTVKNFNIVNNSDFQITLTKLAGLGTYDGLEDGLVTDPNVKTAATWNGAAVGTDAGI